MSLTQSTQLCPALRTKEGTPGEGAGQLAEAGLARAAQSSPSSPARVEATFAGRHAHQNTCIFCGRGQTPGKGAPTHLLDQLINFGTPTLHVRDFIHTARRRHAYFAYGKPDKRDKT